MFQFPGFASPLREMIGLAADRVAPFGNPGITACLQLPQAYRSLPRLSSPPCAKASTVRPYALDLTTLSVRVCLLNRVQTIRQLWHYVNNDHARACKQGRTDFAPLRTA